jgi:hypothetical protein
MPQAERLRARDINRVHLARRLRRGDAIVTLARAMKMKTKTKMRFDAQ